MILVFLLFLIYSAADAQKAMNIGEHMLIKASDKALYGDPAKERVEGTPFLNDNFIAGVVYDNKDMFTDVPMRYNIYDDQIEFKQSNKTFILDPQIRVKKIILDHHIFVVDRFEYKGKVRLGYFILLDSGKVTLMSKKVVTFKEQQAPKALDVGPTPAKYSAESDIFFYKLENGELRKVESIKKMMASLPGKELELSEFVKKEKISRREDDLIRLVKYYNSL